MVIGQFSLGIKIVVLTREAARMAAVMLALLVAGCGGGSGEVGENRQTVLLPVGNGVDTGGGANGPSNPPGQSEPPSDPPPSDNPPDTPPDTPPDNPPADPPPQVVPCPDPARCLDLGRATVAQYKGGKKAAASYTFDDGYATSFAIADMFEARGLRASFYIVPSTVEDDGWASWQDLARRGHEVGNHSMTHTVDLGAATLTEAQLSAEILEAQRRMAAKMGSKPEVVAFPWHSSTAAARAMALSTHLAIRTSTPELPFELAFFDSDHGEPAVALRTVNEQLQSTVSAGAWYVAAGHGVDGDGWSPVTSAFLKQHLDYAQGFGDKLWIDTFVNVARYRLCRKQAVLDIVSTAHGKLQLQLKGEFAASCTAPLTVTLPTTVNGIPALLARDASGAQVPLKPVKGQLAVDILPGQTVTLEAAP